MVGYPGAKKRSHTAPSVLAWLLSLARYLANKTLNLGRQWRVVVIARP